MWLEVFDADAYRTLDDFVVGTADHEHRVVAAQHRSTRALVDRVVGLFAATSDLAKVLAQPSFHMFGVCH